MPSHPERQRVAPGKSAGKGRSRSGAKASPKGIRASARKGANRTGTSHLGKRTRR